MARKQINQPQNQSTPTKTLSTSSQEITIESIELGHPVEIEITMNGKQLTLQSNIEEKLENSVLLTPIKSNGKIVGFPKEAVVNLYYIESGRVYRWNHIQVKTVKYNNQVYHSIDLSTPAEVLNRRGAFRCL